MAFEQKPQAAKKNPRPVVHFNITSEEDSMIDAECQELGLTRSNFFRLCLSDYFFKKEFEVGK